MINRSRPARIIYKERTRKNINMKNELDHFANTIYIRNLIYLIVLSVSEFALIIYCKKNLDIDFKKTILCILTRSFVIITYLFFLRNWLKKSVHICEKTNSIKINKNIIYIIIYILNVYSVIISLCFFLTFQKPTDPDLYTMWKFGLITMCFIWTNIYSKEIFIRIVFKEKRRVIEKVCANSGIVNTYNGVILGILEGFFISTFILIKEYTVIYGFLLFRSIVSFKTNPENNRGEKEHAEFYLIGTLATYLTTIGVTFFYILYLKFEFELSIVEFLNTNIIQAIK